jgi:hypothetical protein
MKTRARSTQQLLLNTSERERRRSHAVGGRSIPDAGNDRLVAHRGGLRRECGVPWMAGMGSSRPIQDLSWYFCFESHRQAGVAADGIV